MDKDAIKNKPLIAKSDFLVPLEPGKRLFKSIFEDDVANLQRYRNLAIPPSTSQDILQQGLFEEPPKNCPRCGVRTIPMKLCTRCRDEISLRLFLTTKCNRCYIQCTCENYMFLPDRTKVILCNSCLSHLNSIHRQYFDIGISLIKDGEKDLARATNCDPDSDYIKTNLSQTRDLFSKLNLTPTPYNNASDPIETFLSKSPEKPKTITAKPSPNAQRAVEANVKKPRPLTKTRSDSSSQSNVFHFGLLFILIIFGFVLGWLLLSLF